MTACTPLPQSLREILKPSNINVLIVYPGPTETVQARTNSPGDPSTSKRMPPGVLAQKIHSAMARGKRWLIPGTSNRITVLVARIAPVLLQKIMRRVIYEAAIKSRSD
jgi:short-subunit dehydrogenase